MPSPHPLLPLLLHGNQLKRTVRTGWVQRGVPNAESVAGHTFGMSYTALIVAQTISPPLDMARLLAMCLLHDLPEGLTTDIPTPAWRFLPEGVKTAVERGAMQEILGGQMGDLMALWEELHGRQTAESLLVHDADKLDMYLQVYIYQQQTGNRLLDEFWTTPATFHYPVCQAIYESLRAG